MSTHTLSLPDASEYPPGFAGYVSLVPGTGAGGGAGGGGGEVLGFMEGQLEEVLALLGGMAETESLSVHAPYAWTTKQVLGHITDAERIFAYRGLRIARNDATPLPSFDENAYMQFSNFNRWPIQELLREFELMRRSHILLFRHMEPEAWLRAGVVSGHRATARAFPYVAAGHAKHHLDILHKRLGR